MKLYTGDPDERCPLMGGKLCSKVCPTCKFQQEFTMTDNTTGAVKSHWDCALAFQTQLLMESNQIGIAGKDATDQLRKETVQEHQTLAHGTHVVAQRLIEKVVQDGGSYGILAESGPRLCAPSDPTKRSNG